MTPSATSSIRDLVLIHGDQLDRKDGGERQEIRRRAEQVKAECAAKTYL